MNRPTFSLKARDRIEVERIFFSFGSAMPVAMRGGPQVPAFP
jgi:hypothetical protein